jgi:Domain of Unknown Function (DUF1080)
VRFSGDAPDHLRRAPRSGGGPCRVGRRAAGRAWLVEPDASGPSRAHVGHWLNGVKAVEYELWTPDRQRRVRASKFRDDPKRARARRGHIGLQDHGDTVAFRNIRIHP